MDPKIRRLRLKVNVAKKILLNISDLSVASTLKVACMALKKDFSKIASFGYNGSYSGADINEDTGTEEDSLTPGESGFIHAEMNMIAKSPGRLYVVRSSQTLRPFFLERILTPVCG